MRPEKEKLAAVDPEISRLIELERERQEKKIILIASESICHPAVRQALDSEFTNIYAEGYPSLRMTREEKRLLADFSRQLSFYRRYANRRYYKGTEYVDFIEALAQRRCAELFATDKDAASKIKIGAEEIYVNVQPLSGAAANNAVYQAFLETGDTVMGMSLTHGGHLTHGSEANRSGRFYRIVPYEVDPGTGKLDYQAIRKQALECRPKMIIAGYSAYPWSVDWEELREIADAVPGGAVLCADIAHPAGLVIAGKFPNPVPYAQVVTFTTHKTLCGPRGAVIMTADREKAALIDAAVFPGEQGGPHINSIAAKAVAFRIAATDEFKQLQGRIAENALFLAEALKSEGLGLAYGGTDSHMVLIDLKSVKTPNGNQLDGEMASRILDLCGITCNKNTIAGDENPAYPSAIRLGTTWVSQLGMGKKQMEELARLIKRILVNIHPFIYEGTLGSLGRGKIEPALMEEVKEGVAGLLERVRPEVQLRTGSRYPHFYYLPRDEIREPALMAEHEKLGARMGEYCGWKVPLDYGNGEEEMRAAREGCALSDREHCGRLLITGERAEAYLQGVITGDLMQLQPGQSMNTFLLDKEGEVIAGAVILKLAPEGAWSRYFLETNASSRERVKGWLRGLSDGYVIFDREDIYRKIEGPVVISDLSAPSGERICLSAVRLQGPHSAKMAGKIDASLDGLREFEFTERQINGVSVIIHRFRHARGGVNFDFHFDPKQAEAVWGFLLDRGKEFGLRPMGVEAEEKLEQESGLPVSGDVSAAALAKGGFGNLFDPGKPYFIGQEIILPALPTRDRARKKEVFRYQPPGGEARKGFLYEEHAKVAGCKFVPFAGWQMPIWFSRISEEHLSVRGAAGLFDVSHMGSLEVSGRGATRFLDMVTTNYVPWLEEGQSQYSYLLDPEGEALDDILVFKRGPERYLLVVNAANNDKVKAWLEGVNTRKLLIDRDNPLKGVELSPLIRDLRLPQSGRDQKIDLALQGPNSRSILEELVREEKLCRKLAQLERFEFLETEINGAEVIISRTGYTGEEIGFEIYVHPDKAAELWKGLLAIGERRGLKPAGLGARDSTRTEAGLPLYGHELAGEHGISPYEAGYGAFVRLHKPFFIGRKSYIEKMKKSVRKIVRFRVEAKGIRMIRPGNPIMDERGNTIGSVTSSVPIEEGAQQGMAFIDELYSVEGRTIGVSLPRPGKSGQEKAAAVEAVILPRFPESEKRVVMGSRMD